MTAKPTSSSRPDKKIAVILSEARRAKSKDLRICLSPRFSASFAPLRFLLFLPLLLLLATPLHAQSNRCGAGRDLIVQALEHAGPQSPQSDFEDALQLLKRAAALCPDLGDAWYYRSLVEAHLGHAPLAKFSLDKAHLLSSEAMTQNLQPFILATPASRGITVEAAPTPTKNSPPQTVAGPLQQKWALVIGIGSFADPVIPKLHYTVNDAHAFATMLTDPVLGHFPADHVHTLVDAQATTRAIKEQLNWIARSAGPDDMVVVYFASHGSPRQLDSVGGLNYLITYDTEMHSLAHLDEDALFATALPMVDLSSAVATRLKSLRTLVVLDTCYSGGSIQSPRMMGTVPNASPSPESLHRLAEGSGRIVFAAARVDQESLESATLQHGYFTYYLLKSLTATRAQTPLSQVFSTVEQQVSSQVHQNPVMDRSSADADFAIGLAGSR
jgi:hypothetical protein